MSDYHDETDRQMRRCEADYLREPEHDEGDDDGPATAACECTPMLARVCPVCGVCTCPTVAERGDAPCPLHSEDSTHAPATRSESLSRHQRIEAAMLARIGDEGTARASRAYVALDDAQEQHVDDLRTIWDALSTESRPVVDVTAIVEEVERLREIRANVCDAHERDLIAIWTALGNGHEPPSDAAEILSAIRSLRAQLEHATTGGV